MILSQFYQSLIKMGQVSGAMNASGFSASIDRNILPHASHITHSGIFNENFFEVGDRAKSLLDIYSGIGVSNCDLYDIPKRNYFLSLFLKSNTDGEKRTRPINVVVCLDVSGSMGGGLGGRSADDHPLQHKSRLNLARDAIKMLYEKLNDDDIFTLVTFHCTAKTIIRSNFKKMFSSEEIQKSIYSNFESGGTTLKSGFDESLKNIETFIKENTLVGSYEHRIVMLTDVCDNSVERENDLIHKISELQNVHTTIIGVSDDFRSETCEKLIQTKGFNYFCAVEHKDLQVYLSDRFDYNFFPCYQNTEISFESDMVESMEMFGTVDSQVSYDKKGNKHTVTKMKSGFPSQLEMNKKGKVETQGGLILVKLKLKDQSQNELPHIQGKIHLRYENLEGKEFKEVYPIDKKVQVQQFYSDEAVQKGVKLFYYTQTIRNLLTDMNQVEGPKRLNDENKGLYAEKLRLLEDLCPKEKKEELEKIIKIVQNDAK